MLKKWSLIASENWWWIGNHDNPGNQVEVGSLSPPIGPGENTFGTGFLNHQQYEVMWIDISSLKFAWFIFGQPAEKSRLRFVEQKSRSKCVFCTIAHFYCNFFKSTHEIVQVFFLIVVSFNQSVGPGHCFLVFIVSGC